MSMTNTAEPAKGNCRWLEWDPVTGNRWLRIEVLTAKGWVVKEYEVEQCKDSVPYCYFLWYLNDLREIDRYIVQTHRREDKWTCTCGDALNRKGRQGNCKHIRALQASLRSMDSGYTKGL